MQNTDGLSTQASVKNASLFTLPVVSVKISGFLGLIQALAASKMDRKRADNMPKTFPMVKIINSYRKHGMPGSTKNDVRGLMHHHL